MAMLEDQQAQKLDQVIPADKMRFVDGHLIIEGLPIGDPVLTEDGVTDGIDPNGPYWPTATFDDQLAAKLDVPAAYLRRLRNGRTATKDRTAAVPRTDLFDLNVNGLLRGRKPLVSRPAFTPPGEEPAEPTVLREAIPADSRSFFVRMYKGNRGGIVRSVLSSKFARLDYLDALTAMMTGVEAAGVDPKTLRIYGDLSETRMFVHVQAPEILAAAPGLLDGYRSPFDAPAENAKRGGTHLSMEERIELGRRFRQDGRIAGPGFYEPGYEPLIHAGFVISNSETGFGRWQIRPEVTVLRCSNGMTFTKEGFGRVHLGSEMDEGTVEWSEKTQEKMLELVTSQTRDVVMKVLSTGYLEAKAEELTESAGKEIAEPEKTIETVAQKLKFSKEERDGVLRHFLMGGQISSGGVMNAVTSYSQTIDDPDAAYDLNSRAIQALEIAFAS